MRLVMLSGVRKDEVMTKKAVVSKAAVWVNKWLMSSAPNGPCCSEWAFGRVDFSGVMARWEQTERQGVTHL